MFFPSNNIQSLHAHEIIHLCHSILNCTSHSDERSCLIGNALIGLWDSIRLIVNILDLAGKILPIDAIWVTS